MGCELISNNGQKLFVLGLFLVLAMFAGHFLAIGWIAHRIGTPLSMPDWLTPLNRFFRYGITGGIDLVIEVFWLALIAAGIALMVYLLNGMERILPASDTGGGSEKSPFSRAFRACLPLGILLWITLAILPLQSHNQPDTPSDLAAVHSASWDDALFELTQGMSAMVIILVLFVGILLAFLVFQRFMPQNRGGSVWQLIVGILFGIVLMLAVGMSCGPMLQKLHEAYGSKITFVVVYAILIVLFVPPGVALLGSSTPK